MFMANIAGVRVLYTGDYSREEDCHLRAVEILQFSPDICIIESTYGVQLHHPRNVREKRFTDVIHLTISQGGRGSNPCICFGACPMSIGLTILSSITYPYIMLPPLQKGAWLFTRHTSTP